MQCIYQLEVVDRDIITDNALSVLRNLTNLRSLDLRLCSGISSEGMQHIATIRGLRQLDLGWCGSLVDSDIGEGRSRAV